ncbi:type 3 dihydrofolate reductase [Psychrobium sp. 1_MG-2023]|uniref:type 3 dihydrofolate reductase n=1 Tax=Psychrobium sp. 1_MG-2023 TaxID=3062624 RepID=UPI000C32009B|nr:type 3 dihydrofolate reductase [Psychrobium sp. 1_MG-2023]MDP2560853.1 type 3 dihydrofolate reductase [Psychrobium sp. 1_MG-2023]PKF56727.1 type 3 dihydrofolate reductase [Alteromonadales bacterium alter-6D02]
MKISMIAAMAANRVIGKDNKMPWHLPEELSYFKQVTMGKPIVMGRNTFESIGRPLPGRKNIVLSSNTSLKIDGVTVVNSIEQAIAAGDHCDELMIIGGARLYEQMLEQVDNLYLTDIELDVAGDAFFPDYNIYQWKQSDKLNHKSKSGVNFSTYTLQRA